MIFTSHKDTGTDYDGTEIKEWDTEFDCPFIPGRFGGTSSICFVIYKGLLGKYKIRECYVDEVVFTNCWSLRMSNGWTFHKDMIGKEVMKYDELDKAIKICEEKNRMRKVRVKRL